MNGGLLRRARTVQRFQERQCFARSSYHQRDETLDCPRKQVVRLHVGGKMGAGADQGPGAPQHEHVNQQAQGQTEHRPEAGGNEQEGDVFTEQSVVVFVRKTTCTLPGSSASSGRGICRSSFNAVKIGPFTKQAAPNTGRESA